MKKSYWLLCFFTLAFLTLMPDCAQAEVKQVKTKDGVYVTVDERFESFMKDAVAVDKTKDGTYSDIKKKMEAKRTEIATLDKKIEDLNTQAMEALAEHTIREAKDAPMGAAKNIYEYREQAAAAKAAGQDGKAFFNTFIATHKTTHFAQTMLWETIKTINGYLFERGKNSIADLLGNEKAQAEQLNKIVQKTDDVKLRTALLEVAPRIAELAERKRMLEKDLMAFDDIDTGDLYVWQYTNPENGLPTTVHFVIKGGAVYAVGSTTAGCIPLPAKLVESASCLFCPLFLTIFNAAQSMSTRSFNVLAEGLSVVLLIGFSIWVAFEVLRHVSKMTKVDSTQFVGGLLVQAFKVLLIFALLADSSNVYGYIVEPVLNAGLTFGTNLLFNASGHGNMSISAMASCSGVDGIVLDGVLPSSIYVKMDCFIRSVQAELAIPQSIGSTLMCVARHVGKDDLTLGIAPIKDAIWDFSMMFQGLIIWVFSWLVSFAFAFYLIDATVRLGIVGILMPFLIVCWPFKPTSKYTSTGWSIFMDTFFTYVFMGLVITVNVELMAKSVTSGTGGWAELENLINGNDIYKLKDALDIGFGGFLILIACCIFGFKLTKEASGMAAKMAGSGLNADIGSNIGGLATNMAISGVQMAAGGAIETTKGVAGFIDEKTGFKDWRNDKAAKMRSGAVKALSFGKTKQGGAASSGSGGTTPKFGEGGGGNVPPSNGPTPPPTTPINSHQQNANNLENANPLNGPNGTNNNGGSNDPFNLENRRRAEDQVLATQTGSDLKSRIDKNQSSINSLASRENLYKNEKETHNAEAERLLKQAETATDPSEKQRLEGEANSRFDAAVKAEENENRMKSAKDRVTEETAKLQASFDQKVAAQMKANAQNIPGGDNGDNDENRRKYGPGQSDDKEGK